MRGRRAPKPIRVFWSPLSERFYASRSYREEGCGIITITGEKFDVTDEIAGLIQKYDITFRPKKENSGGEDR